MTSTGRNGNVAETRYSKDQLLDFFKPQPDGQYRPTVDSLLMEGFNPRAINGTSHGGWGRNDEHKDGHGPEMCWDNDGSVQPLGLIPMTDEERDMFSTSVNSLMKPPAQSKDGTPNTPGVNRRSSISQSQGSTSNTVSRPGGRQRRDSSDLLQSNSVTSPTSSRFSKDESSVTSPPPSLLRRKTDFKDSFGSRTEEKEKDNGKPGLDTTSPIGSLRRTSTNPLGSALNGPSSPWSAGPASTGFAPMGAFGSFGTSDKKPGFSSMRSESRFKSLMATDSLDNVKKSKEQRIEETQEDEMRSPWQSGFSGQPKTLGDLFEDEDHPAGSAALGGDDAIPLASQSSSSMNLENHPAYDDIGFSSLGIGNNPPPFQDFSHRNREFSSHQIQGRAPVQSRPEEPLSPTFTNPYQSPEGDRAVPHDIDTDDSDPHSLQYQQNAHFGRGFSTHDHQSGRNSSNAHTSRGFPSLGGLGGLSGLGGPWSAAPGAIGTPSKAFGDSTFGGFADVSSPHSAGFANSGFFGTSGPSVGGLPASVTRGSKLGSLFPSAMENQARGDPLRQEHTTESPDVIRGLRNMDMMSQGVNFRSNESPHSNRSRLEDLLSSSDDRLRASAAAQLSSKDISHGPPSVSLPAPFSAATTPHSYFATSQDQDQGGSGQLPAPQQKQMVMPDRMRWIYRDPSGNKQGPWSGLEMHDWYKAGFFSPELQVKKQEDNDYEPLAQLIRRIGNSREPFLVPQIGIPHGSPTIPTSAAGPVLNPPGTSNPAQPPFASSFPSFGTTLTAEQQNALERRKQEEQYLMARQKEHLASMQPAFQRQMQQNMQGGLLNQQLHHHSSAHSLQSQPSYGSIASPVGYQPSPGAGAIQPPSAAQGFFEQRNAGPMGAESLGSVREEGLPGFLDRMNLPQPGQMPYNSPPQSQDQYHQQQVNALMQEKARLQREQQQYGSNQMSFDDALSSADRLEEFQRLRAQGSDQRLQQQQGPVGFGTEQRAFSNEFQGNDDRPQEQLSLSEQVQKAAAKQSPINQTSPWAKVDAGMPQPFPPAQPSSPMPAPTPQRNRQSVAEALNAGSQSQTPSQTDSAETPSAAIAPWARESSEVSKGPSLKEIQAMEAKKAAQQEEIAAAARKAVAEQERLTQQNQTIPSAPGLPSSANWASSVSPAIPTTSPWTKPTAGKPTIATPAAGAKKTLAQIQKEEEARKSRVAAATGASSTANAASATVGKSYANLAGKGPVPLAPNPNNTAWTTVGAGGKAKTPTAPVPAPVRSTSANIAANPSTARPKPTISTAGRSSTTQSANDEFQKWTRGALGKGLNPNISADDFISSLLSLPPDSDIISDSIYASSQTLDGRRFAEEFVKRRKLADKGITPEPSSTGSFTIGSASGESKASNGGWSEVAKKGSTSTAASGANDASREFRVVSGKKRGKR
ncbi:uncharacterized protein KY384_008725 [Bacidia gigantensis]|uniref:uncharacterized protein n=1 Tax=Bacidia gigantensis TaxID=2732470 RepID=UPI001D047AB1|nr:uncharacterized protein KY384_008725 [Bacidia gigantensis]KAG8526525.1 hypothetical protein KY384_008725 [Bacidia gigantensis]